MKKKQRNKGNTVLPFENERLDLFFCFFLNNKTNYRIESKFPIKDNDIKYK